MEGKKEIVIVNCPYCDSTGRKESCKMCDNKRKLTVTRTRADGVTEGVFPSLQDGDLE